MASMVTSGTTMMIALGNLGPNYDYFVLRGDGEWSPCLCENVVRAPWETTGSWIQRSTSLTGTSLMGTADMIWSVTVT